MKPRRAPADTRLSTTIAGARALGRKRLAGLSDTPGLDADILLQHATGLGRADLIAHSSDCLGHEDAKRFEELLLCRLSGEPVAYIVGSKSFREIDLIVDRRVLVPRPETEMLVEVGLAALSCGSGKRRLLDVGTGSGAVALSIAAELSGERMTGLEVVASDISREALEVAAINRSALGLQDQVELAESDLLADVEGEFDIILANLPYLRDDQRHPSTAREPEHALYAGQDGLDLYRKLLPQAAERLTPGGIIACEIDPSQGAAMRALAEKFFPGSVEVLQDLAGLDRLIVAGAVDIVRTVAETLRHGA